MISKNEDWNTGEQCRSYLTPRQFALEVVKKLRAAGYQTLWAGGCVRDALLGKTPKDYDVATAATPEQIRLVFGKKRTLAIGEAFGVITVLGPKSAGAIEVATFRQDVTYSDGRHPDKVMFTTAAKDASRRDFTINGLFYDPIEEKVLDYVAGEIDLKKKIVRAIGDPHKRFEEDKLRILRAIRFTTTLRFTLETNTLAAIRDHAAEISQVSAERIGMEIRKTMLHKNRQRGLELLKKSNLLAELFPDLLRLTSQKWDQLLTTAGVLEKPTLAVCLVLLVYYSHPLAKAPAAAKKLGRRLKYSNHETERAHWILKNLPTVLAAQTTPWPTLQRVLIHEAVHELLTFVSALKTEGTATSFDYCQTKLALPQHELNPTSLVSGNDLIRHGIKPGPKFSILLTQIRDAQLNLEISTTEEALMLVDQILAHK